jgi:hypothetical protein
VLIPGIAGLVFDSTSIGQPSLTVHNGTGESLWAYYRPGHGPGDELEPGHTRTVYPLFHRFDDPSVVTFVVGQSESTLTYWECEWSLAKRHEPLLIDQSNDAGCRMFSVEAHNRPVP